MENRKRKEEGWVALFLLVALCSCFRTHDPLIGRWTVEKVNVEFNENIATPDMVRQYGELEKGNVIEISKDSVLTFISDGDTLRGRCSLIGAQLLFDGKKIGTIDNGVLTAESSTPLGKMKVYYKKGE